MPSSRRLTFSPSGSDLRLVTLVSFGTAAPSIPSSGYEKLMDEIDSGETVGPMRAGKIFVESLKDFKVLDKVRTIKIVLYGSLAATGKGHMSPQALLMGLEGTQFVSPSFLGTGGSH
jgi:hypothetical protein